MTPGQLIALALVMGVIGALIGHRKGYPVWGFFMGLVFSVLGLVVLASCRPTHEELVRRERARLAAETDARRQP